MQWLIDPRTVRALYATSTAIPRRKPTKSKLAKTKTAKSKPVKK